jgi:sugar lactone lactonase YvrE
MAYRRSIFLFALLACSCGWLLAVSPQFWENFTQDDLLKGTLTRVSLGPEGKLFLAPSYDMFFDTAQPYIFSMARDRAGNLYLGTGHEGKVFKVDPQGKGSLYFQSKELDVFALALDGSDTLFVGTSPDGKVYKVTGPNQSTEYCNPDDKYIWALLFDDTGNLFVGTGGKGTVLRVSKSGEKTNFYKPDDSNVTCLARGSDGNLLAGTSPGGMILKISAQGKGFTLLDTPMEEIRALAMDRFGTIYAAAASSKANAKASSSAPVIPAGGPVPVATIQALASLADRSRDAGSVSVPGGGKDADGSKSSVIAISKEGSAETIFASEERMVYDLIVRGDDSVLISTGGKGRLIAIDTAKQATVVTDSPEEQMTRMVAANDAVFVAGSNLGKVYRLESQPAQTGTFESRVMDAKVVSSWGKISWRFVNPAGGGLKISTRTGNTDKPDGSWSDWSVPYAAAGQQITNPKARYLQWRAVFDRGKPGAGSDVLERLQIPYLQENLRPQVVSITVLPSGVGMQKSPSMSPGTLSFGSTATSGDGVSLNNPRVRGRELNPLPPRQVLQPGAQSFTWKATDDNDDTLEYSIYFRGEGESGWKLLAKEISETFYTLDGSALPDGMYRIKVVAGDASSNPYGKALIGELISRPFMISNSTPLVTVANQAVTGKRVEITFHAKVGAGRIASGEFSIDGEDWFLIFPVDGIADSAEEDFKFTTPDLAIGEHLIGLRASDGNGNTGTTKLIVKIQ